MSLHWSALSRRLRVDRKRMYAAFQLAGERRVDHAMTFEPALSPEGFCHDIDPVMGLAARPVSGMAFMQMRFVLDMQARRREGGDELGGDDVLHSHDCRSRGAALAIIGYQRQPLRRADLPSVKS